MPAGVNLGPFTIEVVRRGGHVVQGETCVSNRIIARYRSRYRVETCRTGRQDRRSLLQERAGWKRCGHAATMDLSSRLTQYVLPHPAMPALHRRKSEVDHFVSQ